MEKDNNKLVRSFGSEIEPDHRTNRASEEMTRDVLARAKAKDLSTARLRIGDYLLREPDYRQILHWAEVGEMSPEMVLQQLSESVVEPSDPDDIVVDPVSFSIPISFSIEDGAMRSVAWDFERLPFIPDTWEPGLLMRELGFTGRWTDIGTALRINLSMLTTLVCKRIGLEALDLSQVPSLTRLVCSWNTLSELDLTPVPSLTHLNYSYNPLGKLDLTPVPDLTHLACEGNELREIDLTPVPGLTYLACERNELREIDLMLVPGLTYLACAMNKLSEIDLTPVPGLTHLNCAMNELSELDLTPVPSLTHLDCESTNLRKLDLTPVPNLTHLNCFLNRLRELDLTPVPDLTLLICPKRIRLHNAPAGVNMNVY